MDRTNATGYVTVSGKRMFVDANPGANTPGTDLAAADGNSYQEEICTFIEASGQTPSSTNLTQLRGAVRNMFAPLIGSMTNAKINIPTASASLTFTADQAVLGVTLGGDQFTLFGVNASLNLATTGIGGMDTGSAPANSFVGVYLGYDPSTGAAGLFATAATGVLPSVYGGTHQPSGYTASALVTVWPTNGSSLLNAGFQRNRRINIPFETALSTNTGTSGSVTALSIAGIVPPNAVTAVGSLIGYSTTTGPCDVSVYATSGGAGRQDCGFGAVAGGGQTSNFEVDLSVSQNLYYSIICPSGTPSCTISISAYEI